MIQQPYSSQLLEKAVQEFSKLPGIGRKTALRLVLWMLRQEETEVEQFAETIHRMKQEIKYCHICHNQPNEQTDFHMDSTWSPYHPHQSLLLQEQFHHWRLYHHGLHIHQSCPASY